MGTLLPQDNLWLSLTLEMLYHSVFAEKRFPIKAWNSYTRWFLVNLLKTAAEFGTIWKISTKSTDFLFISPNLEGFGSYSLVTNHSTDLRSRILCTASFIPFYICAAEHKEIENLLTIESRYVKHQWWPTTFVYLFCFEDSSWRLMQHCGDTIPIFYFSS